MVNNCDNNSVLQKWGYNFDTKQIFLKELPELCVTPLQTRKQSSKLVLRPCQNNNSEKRSKLEKRRFKFEYDERNGQIVSKIDDTGRNSVWQVFKFRAGSVVKLVRQQHTLFGGF